MAIDNLPSLLPIESAQDYAAQLLPVLGELSNIQHGVWARAKDMFHCHLQKL
jgi:saccharopine dehydrogenase (NAD+, L-lysine-forming)